MVGKRKNKADQWLPPRVYRGKSRYEYRPKGGKCVGLTKRPKDGIETSALKAEVWAAYSKHNDSQDSGNNVSKLILDYHASHQFSELSKRTAQDYTRYSILIAKVFGHMIPADIIPSDIRKFMDALGSQLNSSGKPKIVTANRHHSYLSILFSWGLERDWVESNPAKSVRKFKETPRERYVEDWEYEIVLNAARQSGYPYIAPMMELAYLCRGRSKEIRLLTEHDLLESGIFLDRAKGSTNEITGFSDRLNNAISEAKRIFPNAPRSIKRPIVFSKNGMAIPAESLKTAFTRVKKIARKNGLKENFTFHDIKAKGITDHKDHASGHKTAKMMKVYNRKPDVIDPTR